MLLITWEVDDEKETVDMLDDMFVIQQTAHSLKTGMFEGEIPTDIAISICKTNLLGEYHGILVRNMEEDLSDAEIYLVTWDGEASDGGMMHRVDIFLLEKIVTGELFKQ